MASFGANTFDEPGSRDYAAIGTNANVVAQVIPNNAPWIVRIAPDVARLTLPAQGTKAELDALRGAVGSLANLDHVGGVVAAWLVEVRDVVLVRNAAPYWRWTMEVIAVGEVDPPLPPPGPGDALLTEAGDALLTEDGDALLLEGV